VLCSSAFKLQEDRDNDVHGRTRKEGVDATVFSLRSFCHMPTQDIKSMEVWRVAGNTVCLAGRILRLFFGAFPKTNSGSYVATVVGRSKGVRFVEAAIAGKLRVSFDVSTRRWRDY
jgi:hypothetical protein